MEKKQENELKVKIGVVRRKLAEMRDYKRLIAADGLEPDRDDKLMETELIKRLLWLEKQLNPPPPKRKPKAAAEGQSERRDGKRSERGSERRSERGSERKPAKTKVSSPKRHAKTKVSKRKGG